MDLQIVHNNFENWELAVVFDFNPLCLAADCGALDYRSWLKQLLWRSCSEGTIDLKSKHARHTVRKTIDPQR